MPNIRPTRKQQQPINTSLPPIPVDQIIQIRGKNPVAEGITNTTDVLMKALAEREALRRQAQQTDVISSAFKNMGLQTPDMAGATPEQMIQLGTLQAQMEKANNKKRYISTSSGGIYDTEDQKWITNPDAPKGGGGRGGGKTPKIYGVTPEGFPVFLDNESMSFVANNQPYSGQVLPTTVGTEESRRASLVTGSLNSLGRVRELLTPDVLTELKAIRNSPGKYYQQIASPQARELYSNLQNALANELYLKTGATANPDELERTANMYMASLADNPGDFLTRMSIMEGNVRGFNLRNSNLQKTSKPSTKPTTETTVTPEVARVLLKEAGGDRNKARALAKQRGMRF